MTDLVAFSVGAITTALAFRALLALERRRLRRLCQELEQAPARRHEEVALVDIEGAGTQRAEVERHSGVVLLRLRVPASWASGRPAIVQGDKLLLLRGGEAAEVRVVSHPLYRAFSAYLFPDGELRLVMVPRTGVEV